MKQDQFNSIPRAMKYFAYGTQLVMSVVAPFAVCIWIGLWLQRKYELGGWVMAVSFIAAILIMLADVYTLGKMILRQLGREKKEGLPGKLAEMAEERFPEAAEKAGQAGGDSRQEPPDKPRDEDNASGQGGKS